MTRQEFVAMLERAQERMYLAISSVLPEGREDLVAWAYGKSSDYANRLADGYSYNLLTGEWSAK